MFLRIFSLDWTTLLLNGWSSTMFRIPPKYETRYTSRLGMRCTELMLQQMIYASSRSALLRALGSTLFTDTIFATSKADLTSDAYAAHLRSLAAPKPMSEQEKEMATVRAAERSAGGVTYEASHVRSTPVGWKWADGVESALKELDEGEDTGLVVLVSLLSHLFLRADIGTDYRLESREFRSQINW